MINLRASKAAFKQQAIHFMADPQWVIPSLIAPFVFTIVVLMLYKDVEGPVVLYAVLGGGVLGMWGNTLYSSGWSINFDRMNGTIEPLMVSPTPLMQVIAGRAVWNTLIGLIDAGLVFLFAEFAFQTDMALPNPLLFFVTLIITLLSLSTLGLVLSAFFVMTRSSSVLMQIIEFPLYVACGAMVPLSLLPIWTRPISYALAPSWGVDALRLSAGLDGTQGIDIGYIGDILIMIVITAFYLVIALLLFQRLERKARVDGTLGRY
jgi:ABC-2 type transport system permease protein